MNQSFKELHKPKKPLILLNTWDSESTSALLKERISVIATSSYAVAENLGLEDGENLNFQQLLEIVDHMGGKYLTIDIESGYASNTLELQSNIEALLKTKVVGINIEDSFPKANELMDQDLFIERIRTIKSVDVTNQLFINGRTDIFFFGDIESRNTSKEVLNEAIELIKTYQNAGVDGIFIPGLRNREFIKKITSQIHIPLNIMLDIKRDKIEDYLNLGISRISYGPSVYLDWSQSNLSKELYFSQLIESFLDLHEQGKIELAFT